MAITVLGRPVNEEQIARISGQVALVAVRTGEHEDTPLGTPARQTARDSLMAAEELLALAVGLPEGFRLGMSGNAALIHAEAGHVHYVYVQAASPVVAPIDFMMAERYTVAVTAYSRTPAGDPNLPLRLELPAELGGAHATPHPATVGADTEPLMIGFDVPAEHVLDLAFRVTEHMVSPTTQATLTELSLNR